MLNMRLAKSMAVLVGVLVAALSQTSGAMEQSEPGATYVSQGGTRLRLLLDESNLGGKEVDVGEMTFPPNLNSGEHQHGAVEIFYVVSGELEHVVNGKSTILKPGMAGFVRPADKVAHKTGPGGPTKVVVIWAPAGEAARITARWKREP